MDQLKSMNLSDQALSFTLSTFYGLYFGDLLPSSIHLTGDTNVFPKCSRIIFKNNIGFQLVRPQRKKKTISIHDDDPTHIVLNESPSNDPRTIQIRLTLRDVEYLLYDAINKQPHEVASGSIDDIATSVSSIIHITSICSDSIERIDYSDANRAYYRVSVSVLPKILKTGFAWAPANYTKRDDFYNSSIPDLIPMNHIGLYEWALESGAPLAHDSPGGVIVHDSVINNHVIISSMYKKYIKMCLKVGNFVSFICWYIVEDEADIMRRKLIKYKTEDVIVCDTSRTLFDHDTKVMVILAPSGAGKTHWIGDDNKTFRDADKFIKWPTVGNWWKDEPTRKAVNRELWDQVSKFETGYVYLYNGDPLMLQSKHNIHVLGVVMPNLKRHKLNIESRLRGVTNQPTDMDVIIPNRTALISYAKSQKLRIYGGFNEMKYAIISMYYKKLSCINPDYGFYLSKPMRELVTTDGKMTYTRLQQDDEDCHGCDDLPHFGTHISLRIHTNEYARFLSISSYAWRVCTRIMPQMVILDMLGIKYSIARRKPTTIDLDLGGYDANPSGHISNGLTWLATPELKIPGMPIIYPDFHSFITEYIINQYQVTYSLEPYDPNVAYHRYHETAAGVLGSYVAIKMLLRKGVTIRKRDYIIWRIYCRKILRSISINPRTNYGKVMSSRDDDQRFINVD